MDPEAWQKLENVFHGALELPDHEREAFLDRECAGNAELRTEVEAVLAAHIASDESFPGERVGAEIGPYRLIERIGRGGMGEVYRAERIDDQYDHEVAMKLVRPGLAEEVARRFKLERQILARLQHPNIAPLLDGGVAGNGLPYLVMQYIRGMPITRYAKEHGLSVAERLRLFTSVCQAVQFAHANLIVHRDLKPSNILVTEAGQPMLLDFGIAKLLDPELVRGVAPTTGDVRLMTPDYAAPEQLTGRAITTSTDVYALGILLYELLTGELPFQKATPILAFHRAVLEDPPPRPSSKTRGVSGDLDHIVLMALRKEPDRRYASAGQLGEDVERFLKGKPVIARADTASYRLRKFVIRNRFGVAAGAVVLLVLCAATVITARESHRRLLALEQARVERDEATQLANLMVDIFDQSNPQVTGGQSVTARDLLERARDRIAFELAGQPVVQADMEMAIARAYGALGHAEPAKDLLERALETRRASLGRDHLDVAISLEQLARNRARETRFEEALALLAQAREIRVREQGDRHPDVAANLHLVGKMENDRNHYAPARDSLEEALSILSGTDEHQKTADVLRTLSVLAINENRMEDALGLTQEALEVVALAFPEDHPYVYEFQEDMALAYEGLGRYEEAIELHRDLLAKREKVYGVNHPNTSYSLHNLGRAVGYNVDPEEALPLLERALEIREASFGPDDPAFAHVLRTHAIVLFLTGDADTSADELELVVEIYETKLGETNIDTLGGMEGLAYVWTTQGRHDEALQLLESAVDRGWSNLPKLQHEPFTDLSGDERYADLVQRLRERTEGQE